MLFLYFQLHMYLVNEAYTALCCLSLALCKYNIILCKLTGLLLKAEQLHIIAMYAQIQSFPIHTMTCKTEETENIRT